MVAFANNQGGYLLFGIKDRPREIIGLQSDNFENLDPEKVTTFMRSTFSSVPNFEMQTYDDGTKKVGWIYVHPSEQKPIICTKNGSRCLKDGAIYYRYPARTDVIASSDLTRIIEEQRRNEQDRWFTLFRQTAAVGIENAALLNLDSGVISGPGGTVLIDETVLKDMSFIKEGEFDEKAGAPTLKLVGEIQGSARVVEKKIDPEIEFTHTTKEVGEALGFTNQSAMSNARALLVAYGLQQEDVYMHTFHPYKNQDVKKYNQAAIDVLIEKRDIGEFNPGNPQAAEMKALRRKAARSK